MGWFCKEMTDLVVAAGLCANEDLGIDTVNELDQKYKDSLAEVPAFFLEDPAENPDIARIFKEKPYISHGAKMVQIAWNFRLAKIHRPYLRAAAKNEKYAYNRQRCLEAARKIHCVKRDMEACEPKFMPCGRKVWTVIHHSFMATVMLAADLQLHLDAPDVKEKFWEIRECCMDLDKSRKESAIAAHGIKMLAFRAQKCKNDLVKGRLVAQNASMDAGERKGQGIQTTPAFYASQTEKSAASLIQAGSQDTRNGRDKETAQTGQARQSKRKRRHDSSIEDDRDHKIQDPPDPMPTPSLSAGSETSPPLYSMLFGDNNFFGFDGSSYPMIYPQTPVNNIPTPHSQYLSAPSTAPTTSSITPQPHYHMVSSPLEIFGPSTLPSNLEHAAQALDLDPFWDTLYDSLERGVNMGLGGAEATTATATPVSLFAPGASVGIGMSDGGWYAASGTSAAMTGQGGDGASASADYGDRTAY